MKYFKLFLYKVFIFLIFELFLFLDQKIYIFNDFFKYTLRNKIINRDYLKKYNIVSEKILFKYKFNRIITYYIF